MSIKYDKSNLTVKQLRVCSSCGDIEELRCSSASPLLSQLEPACGVAVQHKQTQLLSDSKHEPNNDNRTMTTTTTGQGPARSWIVSFKRGGSFTSLVCGALHCVVRLSHETSPQDNVLECPSQACSKKEKRRFWMGTRHAEEVLLYKRFRFITRFP